MGIHPFDGENLTYQDRLKFWDDRADSYSSVQQGRIVDDIVDHLFSKGTLNSDSTVLELGSGPGTYSLKIAPRVKRLVCVDASPKMMKRMMTEAKKNGIWNIRYITSDFFELDLDERFDLVISSLCPGTGTAEGLRVMESFSMRHCMYVMWIKNCWDDIHAEMWKHLGKDYSFDARTKDIVTPQLIKMRRVPETLEFAADIAMDLPFESTFEREVNSFLSFGINEEDAMSAVESVLSGMRHGNMIEYRRTNLMRTIAWECEGRIC